MGGRGSLSPLSMTTKTVRNSVSKSQGYISSHRGVTLNVLLRRFLGNPHGYDGRTGSEFRVQRTQEWSYGWNVGFTFVRGATLPRNTLGAPCIFEAHARAGIYGDRLLGSSSEAATLKGRAPAHHASSL
jgi:hypothetical protein